MSLITFMGAASIAFTAWFTWYTYTSKGEAQARREALIEAWISIVIGFTLNFLANLVLLPLMTDGGHVTAGANFWGGWVYTVISLVRQYGIRRWCSAHITRVVKWMASLAWKAS